MVVLILVLMIMRNNNNNSNPLKQTKEKGSKLAALRLKENEKANQTSVAKSLKTLNSSFANLFRLNYKTNTN